jgi:hypothetical protein
MKKWFNTAHLKKNNGFYINYVDGKWISPNDINESEYLFLKDIATILIAEIRQYDNLESIYFLRDNYDYSDNIKK